MRRGMHLVPYSIAVQCQCWCHYVSIGISIGINPSINFLFLNYLYSFIFLQSGNDANSDYFYIGYDTVVISVFKSSLKDRKPDQNRTLQNWWWTRLAVSVSAISDGQRSPVSTERGKNKTYQRPVWTSLNRSFCVDSVIHVQTWDRVQEKNMYNYRQCM